MDVSPRFLPRRSVRQPRRKKAPGDWPMYRHDPASSGYSPLKQIDTRNVTKLAQAWTMPLAERGGLEVTPIVVKGVMYLPGTGKVYALDAATGKEIWHYDIASALRQGVAYWPGDKTMRLASSSPRSPAR